MSGIISNPLLSISVFFLVTGTVFSAPIEGPPLIGACVHFGQGRGDVMQELNLMRQMGLNSFRDEEYWSSIERQAGVLAWPDNSKVRMAIDTAAGRGMQPLMILTYGNSLYGSDVSAQSFVEGYANYAGWFATQVKGKVRHLEIWNEWNGGLGLNCKWSEPICNDFNLYNQLLCAAYREIKKVDSSFVVIGASTSGIDFPFIQGMFENGAAQCLDAVSVHPYRYHMFGRNNAGAVMAELQDLQNRMKTAAGREIPIYITEEGVATTPGGPTQQEAAAFLARYILAAKSLSFIKGIWWYMLTDICCVSETENNFGLALENYTPKQAYYAMRDVSRIFTQSNLLSRIDLGTDIWLLHFFDPDSGHFYALWSEEQNRDVNLIFDASATGELVLRTIGSNPPDVSRISIKEGANDIPLTARLLPVVFSSQGTDIDFGDITLIHNDKTIQVKTGNMQFTPTPYGMHITYKVEKAGRARLTINDLQGRIVRVLTDHFHSRGTHSVTWDRRDNLSMPMAPGIYELRFDQINRLSSHMMIYYHF